MNNPRSLYDRYQAASRAYTAECASDPSSWHRPDVAEFSELRRLLTPHAESGDMLCQYALATILWLGLCCESKEQYVAGYDSAREEATRWWIAAATQGFWPALDNLITSGVGTEAQRAREAFDKLESERHDLVGSSRGMPIYGDKFMQELSRRFYGKVAIDSV